MEGFQGEGQDDAGTQGAGARKQRERFMSFFSNGATVRAPLVSAATARALPPPVEEKSSEAEKIYRELIEQRPALIDEKLKLHARIIDEFNLASLDRLPREEFVREIRSYAMEHVRRERISLNQRELDLF